VKRAAALLPVLLLAALLPLLAPSAVPAAATASATGTGGRSLYVPLEPVRLLDTRTGLGAPDGRIEGGGVRDLRVADGVRVPSGATAVVLNVTVVQPSAATDVRVYPTPTGSGPPPTVSSLNAVPGPPVANLVTVAVGAGGQVRLRNAAGRAHLLADLAGYYTATGAGASLVPGAPRRLLDTRDARASLGPGEVRRLRVVGPDGVPAGTSAVVLNLTAVGATQQTDVRVYPSRPGPPPVVSTANPAPGRTTAAAVVVPVGADGTVSLRNSAGRVHLVVDLLGRYAPGDAGAVFAPVAPVRLLDTRTSRSPLGPGGTRDLVVAGVGVVPAPGTVVVLNVTATGATATSDVRVHAAGTASPGTSNLNVARGQTVANTVVAPVGRDGAVRLRNAAGWLHLVVDLAGWYGPSGDGWDVSWPQCTTAGSATSRLPVGGAFAVVGLTRGRPFTDNECFAAQWAWASSLPGEPAAYLNLNAPGPRPGVDGQRWTALCGTGTATSACGRAYGVAVARYALERLPTVSRSGGRPMVWMDVEGPYANGPFWQTGDAGSVAVNRAVLAGAVETLRAAGYRVGIYTDRGTSPANDWRDIMGGYRLTQTQNWVFRSVTADAAAHCTAADSATGGPVVMVQVQPQQSGEAFDVDHLCAATP
jgi:hypothetical protein